MTMHDSYICRELACAVECMRTGEWYMVGFSVGLCHALLCGESFVGNRADPLRLYDAVVSTVCALNTHGSWLP